MPQAEAVTGQRGAEAEVVGVVGPARGAGAREAEERLQRAKVSHYFWCSSIPMFTLMHSLEMHTPLWVLQLTS